MGGEWEFVIIKSWVAGLGCKFDIAGRFREKFALSSLLMGRRPRNGEEREEEEVLMFSFSSTVFSVITEFLKMKMDKILRRDLLAGLCGVAESKLRPNRVHDNVIFFERFYHSTFVCYEHRILGIYLI